ncbi:MAG: exodeoxyribonuclease VII large subunit, partial [Pseudomonadota bacterium]
QPASNGNLHEFSVSELSGAIKRAMEDGFSYVRVRGEIGRVSRPASGHVYLDLKDDKSVLAGVIWRSGVGRLKMAPEQGLEVIASGRITTFPGQSKYQIVIEQMEPAGAGALMALLEARRKAFAEEGLFAEDRKQPLPYLPDVIGVVTSPSGAVIRDILHRLADRFPRRVLVWPALVQGEKAAEQVAAGIQGFNALVAGGPVPRPDVVIVARGGGSLEDLWPFNEEIVVRAVAASTIPLISAVGHETDTTLIDFVSDRRAPTPTAAAEMAVPVRADLTSQAADLARRLEGARRRDMDRRREQVLGLGRGLPRADDLLAMSRQRLDAAANRLMVAMRNDVRSHRARLQLAGRVLEPARLARHRAEEARRFAVTAGRLPRAFIRSAETRRARLDQAENRLAGLRLGHRVVEEHRQAEQLAQRLSGAVGARLRSAQERLVAKTGLLDALSYRRTLERGYALVTDARGEIVRDAATLMRGDAVTLELAKGRRTARIDDDESVSALGSRKKSSPKTKPARQGDLF